MKVERELLGKIVEVSFLDHCMTNAYEGPVTALAYGKLWRIDKTYIVVLCWECLGKHEPDLKNCEQAIIVTSTIAAIRELK